MKRYDRHLNMTMQWLNLSIENGQGGSCAYFSPLTGWSKPYPETTGYLIPTLLNFAAQTDSVATNHVDVAVKLGEWLLSIQHDDGFWFGLLHPAPANAEPSVFNSAQILKGMCALSRYTNDPKWLAAAERAALWMVTTIRDDGNWADGNYRGSFNPSYYTQVAWPLLEVWSLSGNEAIRKTAETVLHNVLARQQENGVIAGWGFSPGRPAFTHTIAYTLRGLLESARLLDDWPTYGEAAVAALRVLSDTAHTHNGRLPGAFHDDWTPVSWYSCLTGNAQTAICLICLYERTGEESWLAAAQRLIDHVCSEQHRGLQRLIPATRGAVAGSSPIFGRYMSMRYPNWAAKYHCDAMMRLSACEQDRQ